MRFFDKIFNDGGRHIYPFSIGLGKFLRSEERTLVPQGLARIILRVRAPPRPVARRKLKVTVPQNLFRTLLTGPREAAFRLVFTIAVSLLIAGYSFERKRAMRATPPPKKKNIYVFGNAVF